MTLNNDNNNPPLRAIGLMSGTSLDGIDAALITTDGLSVSHVGEWISVPYEPGLRASLQQLTRDSPCEHALLTERALTLAHAAVVHDLLKQAQLKASDVNVIGFHGQTVLHWPHASITWQLGDGALLAAKTGIDVVCDFRRRDVADGGQGAPLVPLYHEALFHRDAVRPIAVVNIGGVGNATFIGTDSNSLLAFDTGPGVALLDDFIEARTGAKFDDGGTISKAGRVDEALLSQLLRDEYFTRAAPKSLDRNHFRLVASELVKGLSCEDGAALLASFSAAAIAHSVRALGAAALPPRKWVICGGGRHNRAIMDELRRRVSPIPVYDIDEALPGHSGDSLEACAFGFLAVRSLYGLPLSVPSTTGVRAPTTGGALHRYQARYA